MTKEIYTNKGEVILVDDEDYEMLMAYTWDLGARGYVRARPCSGGVRKQFLMHRVIVGAKDGEQVDHKDLNVHNNTRANLRIATASENARNRASAVSCKTGYKGAAPVKNSPKFKSYIQVDKEQVHLGYFDNPHDAARMYNFWAIDLYGEFARLNEIVEEEIAC
jgi:hypothetical protein